MDINEIEPKKIIRWATIGVGILVVVVVFLNSWVDVDPVSKVSCMSHMVLGWIQLESIMRGLN